MSSDDSINYDFGWHYKPNDFEGLYPPTCEADDDSLESLLLNTESDLVEQGNNSSGIFSHLMPDSSISDDCSELSNIDISSLPEYFYTQSDSEPDSESDNETDCVYGDEADRESDDEADRGSDNEADSEDGNESRGVYSHSCAPVLDSLEGFLLFTKSDPEEQSNNSTGIFAGLVPDSSTIDECSYLSVTDTCSLSEEFNTLYDSDYDSEAGIIEFYLGAPISTEAFSTPRRDLKRELSRTDDIPSTNTIKRVHTTLP